MTLIETIYKRHTRPGLFMKSRGDAEVAHEWGIQRMLELQRSKVRTTMARMMFTHYDPVLATSFCGNRFENPLGLAAGFDKYAQVYWGAVPAMGFGFVEIGGFTPLPQKGNDRPRLLRAVPSDVRGNLGQVGDASLWNAMGFNNPGKDEAASRIAGSPPCPIPLMVNIGKGKDTQLENAADDYCAVLEAMWELAEYFTINISSPNTQDLRLLQAVGFLTKLIQAVQMKNEELARARGRRAKEIGIKISPDESDNQLADIVSAVKLTKPSYVIATNTSMQRPDMLAGAGFPSDRGGVSGDAVRQLSRRTLEFLNRELQGDIPIISVGGIDTGLEMYERIRMGASLCQVYSALPFEGPDFAKRCLKDVARYLKRDGFTTIEDAVGVGLN